MAVNPREAATLQPPTSSVPLAETAGDPIRQSSLWRDAYRRYLRNKGAVAAAIRVTGGEIEPRLGPQRLLYAAKFIFKIARRGEIIRWKSDED